MKRIAKRGIFLWLICAAFIGGLVFLTVSLAVNSDKWVMKYYNAHVYSDGELVGAGTVYDRNGVVLAETKNGERQYSENKKVRLSTLHVIGDPKGFISTGVQSNYQAELTGYKLLYGVYNIKKYGKGNDMKLTIDSEICNVAYDALNGRKGTVGVMNYKTGEIICAVSSPSYDVNNIPSDINTSSKYEGAYINRLFSGMYTPGSTFKLVTAASAIENIADINEREWTCNKIYKVPSGGKIECNGNHGKQNFEEALANSCNVAFAQIAIELGEERLSQTVNELGLTKSVSIGKIKSSVGEFDIKDKSDEDIGWAGIGQFTTMLSPIALLRMTGAIANGGTAVNPYIVTSFATQAGEALNLDLNMQGEQLFEKTTADKLKSMMRNNVMSNYGDYNYKGLSLCAKSGTAQIDNIASHDTAWFIGFCDDEKIPYCFVVIIEHGGFGSSNAGPVANKVLQALVD